MSTRAARAVDPARAIDRARAVDRARSADHADPAELAELADPADPADLADPADPADLADPVDPAARVAPWKNPYLVSLAVLGVGFVCAGLWLFGSAYSAFNEGVAIQTQGDFAAMQVAMYSGPLFVLFGLATVVGVMFVIAARWNPKL